MPSMKLSAAQSPTRSVYASDATLALLSLPVAHATGTALRAPGRAATGDATKSCFAQVLEQIQNEHAPEFFSERLTPCIPFSLLYYTEHILPGRE